MKKKIIEAIKESMYMDYDVESAEEHLKVIDDDDQLGDILNPIQTVEMFFNGDLNEQ